MRLAAAFGYPPFEPLYRVFLPPRFNDPSLDLRKAQSVIHRFHDGTLNR